MKQNIFSKKNQLDEMQEQTLRKIESRGFWLLADVVWPVCRYDIPTYDAGGHQPDGRRMDRVYGRVPLHAGRMPAQWHLGPPHQGQP